MLFKKCPMLTYFFVFLFSIYSWSQNYEVTLNILNTPNEYGQVIVIAGTAVEVEFIIVDDYNELSQNDEIRLVKISTNEILAEKKRGNSLTGSVSLQTNGSQGNTALGECIVEYVNSNDIIESVPDLDNSLPILIVADEIIADIVERIEIIEEGGLDGVGITDITSTDNGDGTFDITFNKTDGSSVTITTPNLIGNDGVGITTITSIDNGDGTFNVTFNKTDGTSATIITPNLKGNDGVGITNITSVDNGNGTFNVTFNMTDGSQQTITTPDLTGPQGDPGAPGQLGQDGIGITTITSTDNGNGTFNIAFTKTDGSNEIITTPNLKGKNGDQGEQGLLGQDGIHCWDINANNSCDHAIEDINSDGVCDALDCKGPHGEPGSSGMPDGDWIIDGNNIYSAVYGNVGVGTTEPKFRLHISKDNGVIADEHWIASFDRPVAGNQPEVHIGYRADGTSATRTIVRAGNNFPLDLGTSGSPQAFSILNNGNVGIGTSDPNVKLDVHGIAEIVPYHSKYPNSKVVFGTNNEFACMIIRDGNGEATVQINSHKNPVPNKQTYFNAGNVGIGTKTPSQKMHIAGNGLANAWLTSSDERLKKNITPLENSLNKVINLQGVEYEWRVEEYPKRNLQEGNSIGLIAQDVENVLPEVVHTDNDGYKSINYERITAVLIEAVKEQQLIINDIENQIEQLKEFLGLNN